MEFLVELEVVSSSAEDRREIERLILEERKRGASLMAEGHIVRLWRVPGKHASVGIWAAQDADQLHGLIQSLPHYPWIEVRMLRPLATHPLEEA